MSTTPCWCIFRILRAVMNSYNADSITRSPELRTSRKFSVYTFVSSRPKGYAPRPHTSLEIYYLKLVFSKIRPTLRHNPSLEIFTLWNPYPSSPESVPSWPSSIALVSATSLLIVATLAQSMFHACKVTWGWWQYVPVTRRVILEKVSHSTLLWFLKSPFLMGDTLGGSTTS